MPFIRITLALLLVVASVACAGGQRGRERGAKLRRITQDGVEREYLVVDRGRRGAQPVILVLHGGGGDPSNARRLGFEELTADATIVVYPQGRGAGWRDGRDGDYVERRSGEVDDVAFLRSIMDVLIAEGRADARRIYVTGPSNGGMMALRLACEMPERLAAVVAVVALLPEPLVERCKPSESLPVMLMVGTADRLVPIGGGRVADVTRADRGSVASLETTLDVLREGLRCDDDPARTELRDRDPEDAVLTTRYDWKCGGRGALSVLRMEGAGHGWPGLRPRARGGPRDTLRGEITTDFDGTRVAWDFMRDRTR